MRRISFCITLPVLLLLLPALIQATLNQADTRTSRIGFSASSLD